MTEKIKCPDCGCEDIETWIEQEYENGGDDPMYGGKLIEVNFFRCKNGDCGNVFSIFPEKQEVIYDCKI